MAIDLSKLLSLKVPSAGAAKVGTAEIATRSAGSPAR